MLPLASFDVQSNSRTWAIFLGVVFAAVAISLLVASWTRWGQSKPLAKCVGIAMLAHIWLLLYAYGTRIVSTGIGPGTQGGVATAPFYPANIAWDPGSAALSNSHQSNSDVSIPSPQSSLSSSMDLSRDADDAGRQDSADGDPSAEQSDAATNRRNVDLDIPKANPWESPLESPWEGPERELAQQALDRMELSTKSQSVPSTDLTPTPNESSETSMGTLIADFDPDVPQPDRSQDEILSLANLPIDPALAPPAVPAAAPVPAASPVPAAIASGDAKTSPTRNPVSSAPIAYGASLTPQSNGLSPIPPAYQMRLSPARTQFAYQNGGDSTTEHAVEQALLWLAKNQSADGSWNAAAHGAGSSDSNQLSSEEGRYRANAGVRANTAMTGLALLAFLGAGHTHQQGPFADTIQRGLQYLISQQFPSGDLSGRDQVGMDPSVRYARMYSHAIATLAVSEAYAMTNDAALLPTVQNGARYSGSAMNPRTGGWRYDFSSDDPGDTSQFGWQAMVLHSASSSHAIVLAGNTRIAMQRFLDSVSTGRAGGLAVYRNVTPGVPPNASGATPAMTAEANAMRCMLEFPVSHQAAQEARELMLANLPGQGNENLYYWYYATMAMYQMRGRSEYTASPTLASSGEVAWQRWNDSMKRVLCTTQITAGQNTGSWNPTCVWGAYGGRVYSTALSCMCLEVYYRYLPVYANTSIASPPDPRTRK